MGEDVHKISGKNRPFHFHSVNKWQGIGNFLECAAYKGKIKPSAGQPGRQIDKKRAANTTHLLVIQNTAKQ